MADAYAVFVEGLPLDTTLGELPKAVVNAARAAVNATATRGRTQAAQEIARQIAVPASYLAPGAGRLIVGKQATNDDLEANIQGRTRPTSLARFLVGTPAPGQRDVQVAVKPGLARRIDRAFIIKLKSGAQDGGNLGLAVRTDGSPPRGAYKPLQIAPGLFLLYGPSIDQVFKGSESGGRGVRDLIAPGLSTYLETEFNRLLDVGLK